MDFVFTNDDAGGGHEETKAVDCFRGIIEYLDGHDIKGTFFWMPRARDAGWIPGYERQGWKDILHWALDRGHDIQPHVSLGYLLGYDTSDAKERDKFGKWNLQDRLRDSIDIYEKTFGASPLILRPHGDFRFYHFPPDFEYDIEKLFAPLVQAGVRYISLPLPMSRKIFNAGATGPGLRLPLRHSSGIVNYPWVVEDCTPRRGVKLDNSVGEGEAERTFDQWLDIAKRAFDRHRTENAGVGLMNSHWHSMCRDWNQARRFYDLLFDYMKRTGCRFQTLKALIESKSET
ncbi:MAG: hypothetical protein NTW86_03405 [Candidatus Sumerlaeota bacterium]|nr:hypothetical protein [Candidatus Sumerlaeota bacterium]